MQDELVWVSKNKGNDGDKLLLAGRGDRGGYHIACLLDFALGSDDDRKVVVKGSQKSKFYQFQQKWRRKYSKLVGD